MSAIAATPGRQSSSSEFFDTVIRGGVVSVFQPIVDLDTGEAVGFEGLARGPHGPWERPDVMFSIARQLGLLADLDRSCAEAALRAASRLKLLDASTVFINIEPEVIDGPALAYLSRLVPELAAGRVVVEVTERALAKRPSELLQTIDLVRELGWGVALDDVGVEPASLAFMSVLEPDVVKLDMGLVQGRLDAKVAEVMHSVNAYAERSGACILAEGIETRTHLNNAKALGATLGQGWMFGRPTSEPTLTNPIAPMICPRRRHRHLSPGIASPFGALPPDAALRRSPKRLLVELSKQLEAQAARIGDTCVVAATFQHDRHFTALTAERYRHLVDRVGFVAVLGEDVAPEPVLGARGRALSEGDPVRDEWDLVALSPHFSVALLARDLGDEDLDADRTFEYALTYDRDTVVEATRSLLARVGALNATV